MSDVRIMNKIIIQLYNNLLVLWSSKLKIVSLSLLLGCPLFGSNSGLFTVPGFIVSLVGIKKRKRKKSILLAQTGQANFGGLLCCNRLREA